DIGQCAGPIRLRRTLAADFSLAASLCWRPRLPSISAKRFFSRGKPARTPLPIRRCAVSFAPLGVG
ncbi:MAG: hypothetical protein IKO40_11640, partial [Kiritimatiellae bacterium]|nr:hypothetical protein [Kiritimatiellia bacterium]